MKEIGNWERNYKKQSVEVCLQLVADYSKDMKLYAVLTAFLFLSSRDDLGRMVVDVDKIIGTLA